MHVLTPIAKIIPYLLGIYIAVKLGDMLWRESYLYLMDDHPAAVMFWIEFGLLTVVPFYMFMSSDVRRSPRSLFIAASMYVVGILLNRSTVFFIAYQPLYAAKAYIPAIGEFALTLGLILTIVIVYRSLVTLLPVLPAPEQEN